MPRAGAGPGGPAPVATRMGNTSRRTRGVCGASGGRAGRTPGADTAGPGSRKRFPGPGSPPQGSPASSVHRNEAPGHLTVRPAFHGSARWAGKRTPQVRTDSLPEQGPEDGASVTSAALPRAG